MPEEEEFTAEDFSKRAVGEASYTNCTFKKCNFTESNLKNVVFVGCRFEGCNLSLVKCDGCRLQDVLFVECKVVGAEFFKCEKRFFSIKGEKSAFEYCNFAGLPMKKTQFVGCRLKECSFMETQLSEALFRESDLSGTTFHNCDLTKADFTTATHYALDPSANKIKGAKFSLPEAVSLLRAFAIELI